MFTSSILHSKLSKLLCKVKKSELTREVVGWVRVAFGNKGKSFQMGKVVSHYDLSVLFISVMGFQKSLGG